MLNRSAKIPNKHVKLIKLFLYLYKTTALGMKTDLNSMYKKHRKNIKEIIESTLNKKQRIFSLTVFDLFAGIKFLQLFKIVQSIQIRQFL